MADIFKDCHECDRRCINNQFCSAESEISLPKTLKIKIIANPVFWGFNDGSGNVLSSGQAVFSNGHYDFFDGYDELHFATKQCGTLAPVLGPFRDEQRPDVLYRAVYDPDDPSTLEYGGVKNYGGDGTRDDIERGGAEVYLIDRVATTTSDLESCDTSDPTKVYKTFPENFGYGTKISTTDTVFKNKTGAWRYIDLQACNPNLRIDDSLVSECDATPKQNFVNDGRLFEEYDPFQVRVSGERGCFGDGSIPDNYRGTVARVYRENGAEDFINVRLQYNNEPASGVNDGRVVSFSGSYLSGSYTAFGVTHSGNSTYCKLVGTLGSGYVQETGVASWLVPGTYDPSSCCGGVAHNISRETMGFNNIKNYHSDLGRIFNNNKNKLQSNRFPENRYTYGVGATTQINGPNSFRKNVTIPTYTDTGVILNSGMPEFLQEYPYYGAFYEIDKYDTSVRVDGKYNKTQGNNGTCYSKKASVSVYPDCITQYNKYKSCPTESKDKYLINQLSRLAVVYRGCNYDDNCTYDESGRPYFTPTGVEDLRIGLAGQEIYMYVNLSTAWGAEIKRDPCGCLAPVPPGNLPPEMVEIPSPVTFPSFPKFDLYPTGYGAADIGWQSRYYECEDVCWTGSCSPFPTLDHWDDLRQPYTTYGFIRNLCGNEFKDRRETLTDAFSSLIQQGNYTNTSPSGEAGPMYWEFNNPVAYESGRTGGLSGSGNYPFWGLADPAGRLVAPYFRTQNSSAIGLCDTGNPPTGSIPYLSWNKCETWREGWPTDSVPFLLEIDHSDECVGCASVIMEGNNYVLTLQSLDTSFSHNPDSSDKYGYNNCRYKGVAYDPTYFCPSGFDKACPSGLDSDGNDTIMYNEPYTGQTCSGISSDYSLGPIFISGTSLPIGWRSNSTGANSLVRVSTEATDGTLSAFFNDSFEIYGSFKLACANNHQYLKNYRASDYNGTMQELALPSVCKVLGTPLDNIYGNASCNNTYPSADSNLKLESKFIIVASGVYDGILRYMPEYAIGGNPSNIHNSFGGTFDRQQENGDRLWELVEDLVLENALGCPSYMLMYGCYSSYPSGAYYPANSGFYPCQGINPTTAPCDCGGVECDGCGAVTSINGLSNTRLPEEWNTLAGCDCDLKLMKVVSVNGKGNMVTVEDYDTRTCNGYYEQYYCNGVDPCGFVVAIQASGELGVTSLVYADVSSPGYFPGTRIKIAKGDLVNTLVSSACSWHSGPNAQVSGIKYDLMIPDVLTKGETYCPTLVPEQCKNGTCEDPSVGYASCLDPISWSGEAPMDGVTVTRRSCYPETVIVNKVECLETGFRLYIDREYHSHNRSWEEIVTIPGVAPGAPPTDICFPVQKGAYRYPVGTGEACVAIPFATPSDSVTPVYHVDPVVGPTGEILSYRGTCSTHPSSGTFVTQDFVYGPNPVASGQDTLWNYFNLFYESGYPSSNYHSAIHLADPDPAASPPDPENACANGTVVASGMIFSSGEYQIPAGRDGIDWTNAKHSCIQDSIHCGGEFFCNKMFFPRRSYRMGTRVSKFGALSLCRQNSSLENPSWYFGYETFYKLGADVELLLETESSRFVDVCEDSNVTTTISATDIDADYIDVEDYLPLINVRHDLFRYTSDVKSCVIVNTGCTSEWLNTHTNMSISAGVHAPKYFYQDNKTSFGYYLDRLSTVSSGNCLFAPFKAYIDVECCTSNIRTIYDQPYANPTNLEYVLEGVPSWACNGFVKGPACGCSDSTCGVPNLSKYPNDNDASPGIWVPYSHNNALDKPAGNVVCMDLYLAYEAHYEPIGPSVVFYCKPLLCVGGSTPDFTTMTSPPASVTYPLSYGIFGSSYGVIKKAAWGFECGGTIYMKDGLFDDICNFNPSHPNSGLDPSSQCCPSLEGVCGVLANSAAISSTAGCYGYNDLVYDDYSSVWRTCGCEPKHSYYDTCDNSVIKAIITEEM
jgi:hypothetical protein